MDYYVLKLQYEAASFHRLETGRKIGGWEPAEGTLFAPGVKLFPKNVRKREVFCYMQDQSITLNIEGLE